MLGEGQHEGIAARAIEDVIEHVGQQGIGADDDEEKAQR